MIKLDAPRSNNSSLTQVAHESGTNNSTVMARLSAFAQRAMGFGNNVSRNFLKTSKTVALAVAAVFAFSTAQAQVYFNGFDGSVSINPYLTASAVPASVTTAYACPGGGGALVSNSGAVNLDHDFTFNVAAGYVLRIDSITVDMKRASGILAGQTATVNNYSILVNGTAFGTTIPTQTFSGSACNRVNVAGTAANLTGAVTVELNGAVPASSQDLLIDNFYIHGQVTCEDVLASFVTGTSPTCNSGTVSVGPAQTNVNYILYKDGVATSNILQATTPGSTVTFTGLTAGVYTVVGQHVSASSCISPMMGSFTILAQPELFTVSGGATVCVTNQVPVMSPATTTVSLSGSQSGITYEFYDATTSTTLGTVLGTGNAISFNVSNADYTRGIKVRTQATSVYCVREMLDSAAINVTNSTASLSTVGGVFCSVASGTGNDKDYTITGTPNAVVNYTIVGGAHVSAGAGYSNSSTSATIPASGSIMVRVRPTVNQTGNDTFKTHITLTSVAIDGCTKIISTNNTDTIKTLPILSATISGSNTSACFGASTPSYTITVNGRNVADRTFIYTVDGVPYTGNLNKGTSATTNGVFTIPSAQLTGFSAVGTHTIEILSVQYVTVPACPVTSGFTNRTYTVNPLPPLSFQLDGQNLTAGDTASNYVCVPTTQVTFSAVSTSGFNYVIERISGGPVLTSNGTINSNGTGTVNAVNTPAGKYVVTITNPNTGCIKRDTFNVIEQQRPTFAYYVNVNGTAQKVNQNDTINVCAGQSFTDSLTYQLGLTPGYLTITGSVLASTNTLSTTPGTWTSSQTAGSVGTVLVSVRVRNNASTSSNSVNGACDSILTFVLRTNPLPTFNVYYNGSLSTVGAGSTQTACEDRARSVRVTGTPGHTVEIHYVKDNSTGAFPTGNSFTQVQTGVIGANGEYVWSLDTTNTNYEAGYDVCTSGGTRIHYKVEVKNPNTWCGRTLEFKAKLEQRPSVRIQYGYNNTLGVNSIAPPTQSSQAGATVGGANITPMATINQKPATGIDTIRVCYDDQVSRLKFFVNGQFGTFTGSNAIQNSANVNCANVNNAINFAIYKGAMPGGTLVFSDQVSAPNDNVQTTEFMITPGVSGLYTAVATSAVGAQACDSTFTFYVKVSEIPKFSLRDTVMHREIGSATGATEFTSGLVNRLNHASTTNPVSFCKSDANKVIYISGGNTTGAQHTYELKSARVYPGTTGGSVNGQAALAAFGSATTFGNTPLAINLNALDTGDHHFSIKVSTPGTCPVYRSFRVRITATPDVTLTRRTSTVIGDTTGQVNISSGSTLVFCEEEVIEYRIKINTGSAQNPSPSPVSYKLLRGTTVVAQGVTTGVESSVITLAQAINTAGTYTIQATYTRDYSQPQFPNNASNLPYTNASTPGASTINTNWGSEAVATCDFSYSFTVNVNDRPDITNLVATNTTGCHDNNNGSVSYNYTTTVTGTNHIHTQLFRTYTDPDLGTTTTTTVVNSNSSQSTLSVTHPNLQQGEYLLVISNGLCVDSMPFTISGAAKRLKLDTVSIQHACPATTGNVTYAVYGGVAPYTMQVYDFNSVPVGSSYVLPDSAQYQYVGLAPGTYTLRATDATGCIKNVTFTIKNCSSPDLVPALSISNPNFSIANTTTLPWTLNLFNAGQVASTGQIQVTMTLPSGLSFANVVGATSSTAGIFTVLTTNSSVATGLSNPTVISGNIVSTGTPTVGFYVVVANIIPGSGGETNSANNTTVGLLNVNP